MNSATLFGIITSVGLISLCICDEELAFLPVIGFTVISFFTTMFYSLKTVTQKQILSRTMDLPFPEWLSLLGWLTSSILMVGMAALLALSLDYFDFFEGVGELLFYLILIGIIMVIIYWAIVGTIRYFYQNND